LLVQISPVASENAWWRLGLWGRRALTPEQQARLHEVYTMLRDLRVVADGAYVLMFLRLLCNCH
jgi:hypothetical protein